MIERFKLFPNQKKIENKTIQYKNKKEILDDESLLLLIDSPIKAKENNNKFNNKNILKKKYGPEMKANEDELRIMYQELILRYKKNAETYRSLDQKRIELMENIDKIRNNLDILKIDFDIVDKKFKSLGLNSND